MKTSTMLTIVSALMALQVTSAATAGATQADHASVTSPPENAVVFAQASRHFSDWEKRVADRMRDLGVAPAPAPQATPSWYERKTGKTGDSSDAAPAAAVSPFTRFHDRTPKNCTATLSIQRQRPWCG